MSELKPCPFCGGSSQYDTFHGQYRVECLAPKCLASGPWRPTLDEALAAWTAPLALAAAVQGEREACAKILDDESFQEPIEQEARIYAKRGCVGGEIAAFSHADRIAKLIRSRTSPAVDVLGVVRNQTVTAERKAAFMLYMETPADEIGDLLMKRMHEAEAISPPPDPGVMDVVREYIAAMDDCSQASDDGDCRYDHALAALRSLVAASPKAEGKDGKEQQCTTR